MNLLRDFTVIRGAEGQEVSWSFRFAKCQDFHNTLAALKLVPHPERDYEPEDRHLWTVLSTGPNAEVMGKAFDNFKSERETALKQLSLPLMGFVEMPETPEDLPD